MKRVRGVVESFFLSILRTFFFFYFILFIVEKKLSLKMMLNSQFG